MARDRKKSAPWARSLRDPVMIDEESFVEWRETLLALFPGRPGLACPHLVTTAIESDDWCFSVMCSQHPEMRCAVCHDEHLRLVEHSLACVVDDCDQVGVSDVELVVMFDRMPIVAVAGRVGVGAEEATGSFMALGPACRRHGAGKRFVWPQLQEGASS
jgi:hypothetical protein